MMQRNATLDEAREYRYTLERTWNPDAGRVLFIMLNPSTADADVDDATIRRCMGFTARWGKGGIVVGNLLAFRSTDPKELLAHHDPVGPENDAHLRRLAQECNTVVAAWGNSASGVRQFQERQAFVKNLLKGRMQCLGTNRDGTPKHPVRLPASAGLRPFS